jgi:hypothetical protein
MGFRSLKSEHPAVAYEIGVVLCNACKAPLEHEVFTDSTEFLRCPQDILHTIRGHQSAANYAMECCDDDDLVD